MTDYKLVPVEPTAEMLQAACDEEQRPLPMWSRMKAIYTAMLAAAPAVQGEPVDDSLTPVPDELFAAEFNAWWEQHGQFCRAGGGDYECTFAFEAWRYLYPRLVKLQTAAAEQQPAPDVAGLAGKMARLIAAGNRLNAEAEECTYDDGMAEVAGSEYWCEFRDALEAATEALAAHRKQGGEV